MAAPSCQQSGCEDGLHWVAEDATGTQDGHITLTTRVICRNACKLVSSKLRDVSEQRQRFSQRERCNIIGRARALQNLGGYGCSGSGKRPVKPLDAQDITGLA
eukprot:1005236-Pyramimonas_sp.AAC.1